MKPEQLKVIAEGMGIKVQSYEDKLAIHHCNGTATIYNPLTNDTQAMEIIEKLHMNTFWWNPKKCWASFSGTHNSPECYGKTINEAVCNAAYEYFN